MIDLVGLYGIMGRCRVGDADLAVTYRRRDRENYLAYLQARRGASEARLSRADGGGAPAASAAGAEPAELVWRDCQSEFVYRAGGAWKETSSSGGAVRVSECAGHGAPVLVDGQAVNPDDSSGRSGAWRLHIEPGLRHLLEPAILVAASRITAFQESDDDSVVVCEVEPVNVDVITTPLVSPWADRWTLTVDLATGRALRAVSERAGQIVVEHELVVTTPTR